MWKIVICALLASLAFAQSVDDFDAWMRTIDDKIQSVQRNIAAKDSSAALADAQVLQETFKMVEGFWKQRGNAPDAVELSQKAQALAGEVVKAATAKDFDAASAQSIKIAETCTSCHRLYRPL
jgi:ABC-type branched-subunit amino acid transport system substrate-binding protein